MKIFSLALVGFGNVNRTLVELLQQKELELRDRYAIQWRISGIGSRRLGWLASADGFNPMELLRSENDVSIATADKSAQRYSRYSDWLRAAQPDVVFEATSLNVENGQPAIEYIRGALE